MRNLTKAEITSMQTSNNVVTWQPGPHAETHKLFGSTVEDALGYFIRHYAEQVPPELTPIVSFEGHDFKARRQSQTDYLFGGPKWRFESLEEPQTVIEVRPKAKKLFMISSSDGLE